MWVRVKTIVGGPEGIRLTQMCILRGQRRLSVVPKASDQPAPGGLTTDQLATGLWTLPSKAAYC